MLVSACTGLLLVLLVCLLSRYSSFDISITILIAARASSNIKQDLRRIYRRGYEFLNSSLFTRMHCI